MTDDALDVYLLLFVSAFFIWLSVLFIKMFWRYVNPAKRGDETPKE